MMSYSEWQITGVFLRHPPGRHLVLVVQLVVIRGELLGVLEVSVTVLQSEGDVVAIPEEKVGELLLHLVNFITYKHHQSEAGQHSDRNTEKTGVLCFNNSSGRPDN